MKTRKNYIAISTPTLTQSGLLAELLQHQQHCKMMELARRREEREQGHGFFRNSLARLLARARSVSAARPFRRGLTIPRHT
jgi:hypothetical protein